jgi:uroporphyrinogen-III synthase
MSSFTISIEVLVEANEEIRAAAGRLFAVGQSTAEALRLARRIEDLAPILRRGLHERHERCIELDTGL